MAENEYGRALKEARVKERRKLQEVASEASVSVSYLSDVEHGRSHPLDAERTVKIAKFLSVDPDVLLELRLRVLGTAELRINAEDRLEREVAAMLMRRWRQLGPKELEQIKLAVESRNGSSGTAASA